MHIEKALYKYKFIIIIIVQKINLRVLTNYLTIILRVGKQVCRWKTSTWMFLISYKSSYLMFANYQATVYDFKQSYFYSSSAYKKKPYM